MSRSLKKGIYVSCQLVHAIKGNRSKKKFIKTSSRASMVIPMMIGYTIAVHNGRDYIPVFITEEMIGHRLGEFSVTRKFSMHSGDRKTKGK